MRKWEPASAASLPSNILIEEWGNAFYSREEENRRVEKILPILFRNMKKY